MSKASDLLEMLIIQEGSLDGTQEVLKAHGYVSTQTHSKIYKHPSGSEVELTTFGVTHRNNQGDPTYLKSARDLHKHLSKHHGTHIDPASLPSLE